MEMHTTMNGFTIRFEEFDLDNGLHVILHRDAQLPIVAVNLWYHVGSKNEREGKTGFAHLFEHMMFQGSAHVPPNGHFDFVQKAGGTLNGSTSCSSCANAGEANLACATCTGKALSRAISRLSLIHI